MNILTLLQCKQPELSKTDLRRLSQITQTMLSISGRVTIWTIFFSGLLNKVVKGIAIFSLSLVSVEERRSYPLGVEQVIRTQTY